MQRALASASKEQNDHDSECNVRVRFQVARNLHANRFAYRRRNSPNEDQKRVFCRCLLQRSGMEVSPRVGTCDTSSHQSEETRHLDDEWRTQQRHLLGTPRGCPADDGARKELRHASDPQLTSHCVSANSYMSKSCTFAASARHSESEASGRTQPVAAMPHSGLPRSSALKSFTFAATAWHREHFAAAA